MNSPDGRYPIASAPGVLAIAAWSVYLLSAIFHALDVPPWVAISTVFGVLGCIAVVVGYKHWRIAVLSASSIYLLLYAVRVIQMAESVTDSDKSSLISALAFYYRTSWRVTSLFFQERGIVDGSSYVFLEYIMPALMLALIGAILLSRPRKQAISETS